MEWSGQPSDPIEGQFPGLLLRWVATPRIQPASDRVLRPSGIHADAGEQMADLRARRPMNLPSRPGMPAIGRLKGQGISRLRIASFGLCDEPGIGVIHKLQ